MSLDKKPEEISVTKLIALINETQGDFLISIELGEEADENEKASERIQA